MRSSWSSESPLYLPVWSMPCSSQMTSQNLAPIWLPHWPPWMCRISLIFSGKEKRGKIEEGGFSSGFGFWWVREENEGTMDTTKSDGENIYKGRGVWVIMRCHPGDFETEGTNEWLAWVVMFLNSWLLSCKMILEQEPPQLYPYPFSSFRLSFLLSLSLIYFCITQAGFRCMGTGNRKREKGKLFFKNFDMDSFIFEILSFSAVKLLLWFVYMITKNYFIQISKKINGKKFILLRSWV